MDTDFLLQRGRAHLTTQPERAATLANITLWDIAPNRAEWHSLLSQATAVLGDHVAAAREASRALILKPDDPTLRRAFEGALGRLGESPQAPPDHAEGARALLARMRAPAVETPGASAGSIDIYLSMGKPNGSELNALEMARRLRAHADVRVWTDVPPHPLLVARDPTITMIGPGNVPTGDTLAIMAAFPKVPDWLAGASPRRVILHFNVFFLPDLLRWTGAISARRPERIDILYPSAAVERAIGIPGTIIHSPVDTATFAPRPATGAVRTVGRMSRDAPTKHHPQDPVLYNRLIDAGYEVKVLGAEHLRPFVTPRAGLTLLPAHAVPARDFLHGLDLFLYRSGNAFETWGRVVTEAMACGLPVVCHRAGGYAEIIRHGENGYLFDTEDEAVAIIDGLRGDTATTARIGAAARQTVLDLFTPETEARIVEYFLSG